MDVVASVLEVSSTTERADFAYIALDEMRLAYEAEARTALDEVETQRVGGDEVRWVRATDAFAAHLAELIGGIDVETEVSVRAGPQDSVTLIIEEQPVVIGGPRIGEARLLERRILDRYCAIQLCRWPEPEPEPGAADAAAAPRPGAEVPITWSFRTRGHPTCEGADGLALAFDSTEDLDAKRRACAQAMREMRALGRALARYVGRGGRVDWAVLRVETLAGGRGEHVRVDRDGHYVRASLPLLAASPGLVDRATPWIRAYATGGPSPLRIPHAERHLAAAIRTGAREP